MQLSTLLSVVHMAVIIVMLADRQKDGNTVAVFVTISSPTLSFQSFTNVSKIPQMQKKRSKSQNKTESEPTAIR